MSVYLHLCEQPTDQDEPMVFAVEPGLRMAIRSELSHRKGESWTSRRIAIIEATSAVFGVGRAMAQEIAVRLGEIDDEEVGQSTMVKEGIKCQPL